MEASVETASGAELRMRNHTALYRPLVADMACRPVDGEMVRSVLGNSRRLALCHRLRRPGMFPDPVDRVGMLAREMLAA